MRWHTRHTLKNYIPIVLILKITLSVGFRSLFLMVFNFPFSDPTQPCFQTKPFTSDNINLSQKNTKIPEFIDRMAIPSFENGVLFSFGRKNTQNCFRDLRRFVADSTTPARMRKGMIWAIFANSQGIENYYTLTNIYKERFERIKISDNMCFVR